MGGQPITNEVAKKVLKKLKAVDITRSGAAHPKFAIYHEDEIVSITGLRRASNRDIPLPHVKRDLRVSAGFVLELAACPKSRNDWLRELGYEIVADDDDEQSEPT